MIGPEGTAIAVTIGKDLHLLPPVSRSLTDLPNEMLSMILKLLRKDQLKSVRCACKFFETMVSPLLFDKVYISPHRKNLDVFRQIAEHSNLCRYPRELVYDTQKFKKNFRSNKYYEALCTQMRSDFRGYGAKSSSSIHYGDKDIECLLRMTCGSPHKYADHSDFRVVQRGLELYLEKVKEENYYDSSGQLLACLCVGLMKLPNVDRVRFQSEWNSRHLCSVDWSKSPQNLRIFSSPLARSWSPFYLRPNTVWFEPSIDHELDNVMSAFSITKKPLRALNATNVSYKNFYSGSLQSETFCQHSRVAMCRLRSLNLEVYDEGTEEKTLPVDLLANALLHLPELRCLSLGGTFQLEGTGLMSFKELFQAARLPALELLRLSEMLGSAAEILSFLRSIPRLRGLHLIAIELSEGTWVGLVNDMRRFLLLGSLTLDVPLSQGGVDLWDEDDWAKETMSDRIEDYVLHGGKNPLECENEND